MVILLHEHRKWAMVETRWQENNCQQHQQFGKAEMTEAELFMSLEIYEPRWVCVEIEIHHEGET